MELRDSGKLWLQTLAVLCETIMNKASCETLGGILTWEDVQRWQSHQQYQTVSSTTVQKQ